MKIKYGVLVRRNDNNQWKWLDKEGISGDAVFPFDSFYEAKTVGGDAIYGGDFDEGQIVVTRPPDSLDSRDMIIKPKALIEITEEEYEILQTARNALAVCEHGQEELDTMNSLIKKIESEK